MSKRTKIILGLAIASGAAALAYTLSKHVVKGSGNVVKQMRTITPFHRLVVSSGPGMLHVRQADETSLEIEADDNLIERVETTVQDDTLTVRVRSNNEFLRPSQPIEVHVATPTIELLKIENKGKITMGEIKADHLTLEANGSGSFIAGATTVEHLVVNMNGVGKVNGGPVTAKQFILNGNGISDCALFGSVDSQVLNLNGITKYRGRELQSKSTQVIVSGIADATVWAEDSLNVEASGPCHLVYRGEPKLEKKMNGPGKIEKLAEPTIDLKAIPATPDA